MSNREGTIERSGENSVSFGNKPHRGDMILTDEQVRLLAFSEQPRSSADYMRLLHRRDRATFRNNVLNPLLTAGHLAMTIPEKPRSPKQRYIATKQTEPTPIRPSTRPSPEET
jgi:hypothetical protein